jgi:hypothetical protein
VTPGYYIGQRGYLREIPQWERKHVTICIAAACTHQNPKRPTHIVTCTDWRVTNSLGTADTKVKQHYLREEWRCLAAGVEADILRLVILLREHMSKAETIDDTNVLSVVRAALNERKKEKIDEFTHGRYGMPYQDFLNIGKEKLPSDLHREAVMSIADITLRASCIIAGFMGRFPTIVETTDRCTAHIREDFATIGEGAFLAQAALLQREQSEVCSLPSTIYQVYEAKRYAERVTSVGPNTLLTVVSSTGKERRVGDKAGELLEKAYEKFGPQQIALAELKSIERLLELD